MGSRINFDSSINAWAGGGGGRGGGGGYHRLFKASLLSSNETDPLSASVFTQTSEPGIEIIIKSKKSRAYSLISIDLFYLSALSNLNKISL